MLETNLKREERELEHFNKLAGEHGYSWWGSKTPAAKLRIKRRIELIKQYLEPKPLSRMLECGCGSGDFTENISNAFDKSISIHAMDLSEAQINLAKKNLDSSNVYFETGSITAINHPTGFFDFVVGNSILHHLDLLLALSEIKRVLKENGKLLFFEPNMLNPHVWLALNVKPLRKLYQASDDETAFFRWELEKQLKSLGFKNVIVKPFDFVHPLIPKNFLKAAKSIENMLEKTVLSEIAGSLIIFAEK